MKLEQWPDVTIRTEGRTADWFCSCGVKSQWTYDITEHRRLENEIKEHDASHRA